MTSPFVAVDGEGLNSPCPLPCIRCGCSESTHSAKCSGIHHEYTLLAVAYRDPYGIIQPAEIEIHQRDGPPYLEMDECIKFLFEHGWDEGRGASRVCVGFALGYDINMIFKYASEEIQRAVFTEGATYPIIEDIGWYKGDKTNEAANYPRQILARYLPRKILILTEQFLVNSKKGNPYWRQTRKVKIYDAWGFFQMSFEKALKDWGFKVPKVITRGKKARDEFNTWSVQDVINYNRSELEMLIPLMELLESKCEQVGIRLKSWHGAGAIANCLLDGWGFKKFRLGGDNTILKDENGNHFYEILKTEKRHYDILDVVEVSGHPKYVIQRKFSEKDPLHVIENLNPMQEAIEFGRRNSYFGGRIELVQSNIMFEGDDEQVVSHEPFEEIYHGDINSAYPYGFLSMPGIKKEWRYVEKPNEDDLFINPNEVREFTKDRSNLKFGLIHVKWDKTEGKTLGPFPYREKTGYVIFPPAGEGTYHIIEVLTAIRKGYNVRMLEGWVMEPPYDYPYREHVTELARKRLAYKNMKPQDAAHKPIKLGLNSLYGKVATRPTDTQPHPPYRDLLCAGYLTAQARSTMLFYADELLHSDDEGGVVLFATDGIYSRTSLKIPISDQLGDFEFEFHDRGVFLLAGIYAVTYECDKKECALHGCHEWKGKQLHWENKERGYTDLIVYPTVFESLKSAGEDVRVDDDRFIGVKMGLAQHNAYRIGEWAHIVRKINPSNNHKRSFVYPWLSYPREAPENTPSAPYLDKVKTSKLNTDEENMEEMAGY